MSNTLTVPSHYELTIRRPNGVIETVPGPAAAGRSIDERMFARIKQATADGGKGEVLSYANMTKEIERDPRHIAAAAAERAYNAGHNAVANMASMGERDETRQRVSRAPAHKAD